MDRAWHYSESNMGFCFILILDCNALILRRLSSIDQFDQMEGMVIHWRTIGEIGPSEKKKFW